MSATTENIEREIEEQISVLQTEQGRLEAALAVLRAQDKGAGNGRPIVVKRRRGRPPKTEAVTRELKRTRSGGRRDQILALLGSNLGGMTAAEIAEALGISRNQPHAILRALISGGLVSKDGKTFKLSEGKPKSNGKRKHDRVTENVLAELGVQ